MWKIMDFLKVFITLVSQHNNLQINADIQARFYITNTRIKINMIVIQVEINTQSAKRKIKSIVCSIKILRKYHEKIFSKCCNCVYKPI